MSHFTLPRFALLAALLVGSAGSSSAQQTTRDSLSSAVLPAELDRVLRDYERHWRGRHADSLAALFTADGFILRPGHPPVQGRQAIAEAYRSAGGPLHLRALHYAHADSVAYIIGAYRWETEGTDTGKYILTLRRMPDGRWYISADMDNSNH